MRVVTKGDLVDIAITLAGIFMVFGLVRSTAPEWVLGVAVAIACAAVLFRDRILQGVALRRH